MLLWLVFIQLHARLWLTTVVWVLSGFRQPVENLPSGSYCATLGKLRTLLGLSFLICNTG